MICANCGGTIHINEKCEDCDIEYDEMLENITHPEMKSLFRKIEKIQSEKGDMSIEESLMACELVNSSFIIPANIKDESISFLRLPGPDDKLYYVVFTDMNEYNEAIEEIGVMLNGFEECDIFIKNSTPLTNSWKILLTLLEYDSDGFFINMASDGVFLGRPFIEQYFQEDIEASP